MLRRMLFGFALFACNTGSTPGAAARPEAAGGTPGISAVDESAPGVTVRGLSLSGPPPQEVAAALAASAKPAPPLPSCKQTPKSSPAARQPELVIQDGHTQMIMDLELSDDGHVLASAGVDGIVRVWDTRRGLLLRRISSGAMTYAIALAGSADVLAVYAPQGDDLYIETHVLDKGGRPKMNGKGAVGHEFELTRSGNSLAAVSSEISIFDALTGKKAGKIALPEFGQTIAVAPSKDRVAVGMTSSMGVADLRKKKLLRHWKRPDFAKNVDTALKLRMSDTEIAALTYTGAVVVYPTSGGKGRTVHAEAQDIAVVGDSVWVLARSSKSMERYGLKTGKKEATLPAELLAGEYVKKIAASEDGSTLALGGQLGDRHVVRVVDAVSGNVVHTLEGQASKLQGIAVSPAFDRLVTGSPAGMSRWSLRAGQLSSMLGGDWKTVSFGPKGKAFVGMRQSTLEQRDAKTGALLRRWGNGFTVMARVPGTDAVVAQRNGKFERFVVPPAKDPKDASGLEVNAPAGEDLGNAGFWAEQVRVTPNGKAFAFFGRSTKGPFEVHVAPIPVGKLRWSEGFPNTTIVQGIAVDNDRLILSAREVTKTPKGDRYRGYLRVYDLKTGKLRERRPIATWGPLEFQAQTLAVGGRAPALLDGKSLKPRAQISVPDTEVSAIASHAERGMFLLGGDSGVTSLVSAADGKVRAMLLSTPDGEYVAATPQGAFKASLDGARHVGWTFAAPLEGFSFDQFGHVANDPKAVIAALAGKGTAKGPSVPRPPRVRLGKTPSSVDADRLKISATTSADGWVERVRVFVNGRPVADELVCAKKKTVEVDAPLSTGRNRVSVIAYDAAGFSSNPAQADVTSTHKGARPDLWVISAGVSRYPKMPEHLQLEFADDDASSISDALAGLVGKDKPFGELKLVTLLNAGVTPANVERSLASLAEMKPSDLAVVFLAGHGVRLSTGKMVFLTSDASLTEKGASKASVGWDRIQAVLRAAKGRTILMLDACHSGHLSTDLIAPNEQLAAELAGDNRAGVLVFAASRGSQFSYEVGAGSGASRGLELAWQGKPQLTKEPAKGHGLFTAAVLEALKGDAVDRDASGAVELTEFIGYVTERVRAASNGRQTPWVVRREMFGDYAIAPAG